MTLTGSGGKATLTVSDAPTDIAVRKVDENGDAIANATLALYTDVSGALGAYINNTRFVTATDDAGTANVDESIHRYTGLLKAGASYWLKEESAPSGYVVAAPIRFTVGTDAATQTLVMTDLPLELTLSKRDSDALVSGAYTGKLLDGVTLTLTGPQLQTDGTTQTHTWTWSTTDSNPYVLSLSDGLVPGGEYTLHEDPSTVPTGYLLAADMKFKLPANGGAVSKVMVDAPAGSVDVAVQKAFSKMADGNAVPDSRLPASVTVNLLRGVLADGSDGVKIDSYALTAADLWQHTFTGLLKANASNVDYVYTVTEESVSGYTLASISADTDTTENFSFTLTNTANEATISKRIVSTTTELPGAHLQVLDASGAVVEEWDTTDTPHVLVAKLNPGVEYTLKETGAPAGSGYLVTTSFTFTLDTDMKPTVNATRYGGVDDKGIIYMEDALSTITISKQGTGGAELSGASLAVTHVDQDGKTVTDRSWTSGYDLLGNATGTSLKLDGLATGVTYTLTETNPPAGYKTAEDILFIISADGSIQTRKKSETTFKQLSGTTLTMTDGYNAVTFSKKALVGSNELPGATLTLTDITANQTGTPFTETWVSGTAAHTITGQLTAGHTYALAETTAPNGYAVTETVTFKMNADGTITAVSTPANTAVASDSTANTVTMRDKQLTLTVSKMETGDTTNKLLSGASLTLTDTTAGKEVGTWSSTGSAKVFQSTAASDGAGGLTYTYADPDQIYPLIAGHSYTLTENSAPSGYVMETASLTFTVATDGSLSNVSSGAEYTGTALTLRNRLTELSILKVDDLGAPVKNATLSIYTSAGETATTPGAYVCDVQTDANGQATVTGKLNLNTWYMAVETVTPDGYETATPVNFQLQSNGTKTLRMEDPRTLVYVGKRDINNQTKLLKNAVLVIYGSKVVGGVTVADTDNVIQRITTLDTDPTPVYGLVLGQTYFLYEEVAPDGYLRDTTTYTAFTVRAGGVVSAYSYDPQTGVDFNKLSNTTPAAQLGGAHLVLVKGTRSTATAADVVDEWDTSATENHNIKGLLIGQVYTLYETVAPEGYSLATGDVSFKINEAGYVIDSAGNVTDSSTVSLVSITDTPVTVTFSKTSLTGGAEIPGAQLTLTDITPGSTGKTWTWTSEATPHVITGELAAGHTYTLTEVVAPSKYALAETITFTVGTDGTVTATDAAGNSTAAANGSGTVSGGAVTMKDAYIRFKVAKVDKNDTLLANAVFKVVADISGVAGTEAIPGFDSIVSGTTPTVVSGLPKGSYWLVETQAPTATDAKGNPVYYQLAVPKAFTLTDDLLSDDQLVTVKVQDEPTTVTILKLDALTTDASGNYTGNRVKDATLTLTRKSDNALMGTHTFDGLTDWILSDGSLEPGEVYVLHETLANTPEGYLCAYDQEFQLASDGNSRWVIVDDPIPMRKIIVQKQWGDSATTHDPVVFDLYRSDDATKPYQSAALVSPALSVTFDKLPSQAKDGSAFTYTVVESAVNGYLAGVLSAPVDSADGLTTTYTAVNTPTTLIISKLDAGTGGELPGATLAVVRGNGVGYASTDIVAQWTSGEDTDASGNAIPHTLTGKLTVGEQYTLLELAAPTGYAAASPITFTVQTDGTNSYNNTNKLTLTDAPITVKLGKVDNLTGKLVAGATLAVYAEADWPVLSVATKPIFTFTSKTELSEFSGVLAADQVYWLAETQAPGGYQLNSSAVAFKAPKDGTAVTVTMSNALIYRFAKISSTTGAAVPGATLTVTDLAGNVIIPSWQSTGSAYEYPNRDPLTGKPVLQTGVTYRLVELAAPSGYALTTTAVTFQLDANGLINGGTTVTMVNVPQTTPTDDKISLTISKTWVDNSNAGNTRPTAGLKVNVYRKLTTATDYGDPYLSVTVPNRTGNRWYLTIVDLDRYNASGVEYDYIAREVVPTGYTVAYSNDGFTMVNTYPNNNVNPTPTPIPTITPTPAASESRIATSVQYVDGNWVYIDDDQVPLGVVPQTGDESDYLLWGAAILLPLLLAVFGGLYLWRRKRRSAAHR